MSSLLFSTLWRRLQLRGSKNHIILLTVVVVFICGIQLCFGDIEPKPNYEDLSTPISKLFKDQKSGIDERLEVKGAVHANGIALKPDETTKSSVPLGNLGFLHAFIASISVILVSELGDKTFFIAAIMAMRHPRITVFVGAISALAFMTILSAVFGMAAQIIPRVYTYYISTFLFAIFGLKMLKEGYYMKPSDAQEEYEEVQQDLRKREDELMKSLKDGSSSVKNSNIDVHCNSNRGSNSSLRILRKKEGYDSDAEQTDVMLKKPFFGDTNDNQIASNIGENSQGRRSQSAMNLSTIHDTTSTTQITRYPINLIKEDDVVDNHSTSSQSLAGPNNKINQADINCNGMELKQFGSKKLLEKETSVASIPDPESGVLRRPKQRSVTYITSRILMQAFTMTFLAEWGDRSQLTTIILSAREDVYGVIIGGILGHSICTGLAVIGGRMIAQRISVRTVTLVGGVVFLVFAVSALFFNPNDE